MIFITIQPLYFNRPTEQIENKEFHPLSSLFFPSDRPYFFPFSCPLPPNCKL